MISKVLSVLILSFIYTFTASCNDVGLRFTKIEDVDRCFVTLDIRDKNHKTIIPLDNKEFIKASKNIYLPEGFRRVITNIVLEYRDSVTVIPDVSGDIIKFKKLRTSGDDATLFWYGSAYGLGNHKRVDNIYIIGIHKDKVKLLMDNRNLYELGYNAGKISSANDLFIAKDGSLVLNPFKSTDVMSKKQAKLIWDETNGFNVEIGDYKNILVVSKELASWPYYMIK